ncbi:MAG TPA: thioredoxin family protein, partial [Kiritimatiellia bacterium]|nr:thioredoxin family protein [Kiritimatiellia bacterium]
TDTTAPADSPFHTFDFATDAPAQLDALLAAAAASGRPVLLDFGAHWCKSCHWMDATTLRDPAVLKQLQNMFAIRILADRPNRPPARDALAPFGIQGYPTYLLYPAATPAD